MANISAEPFSEALAHLFIMYGAGYISFEKLESIARDADKFKDEILSAENFIIEQSSKDEKERVSEDIIQRILFCTINSKKYPEIQTVASIRHESFVRVRIRSFTTALFSFVMWAFSHSSLMPMSRWEALLQKIQLRSAEKSR